MSYNNQEPFSPTSPADPDESPPAYPAPNDISEPSPPDSELVASTASLSLSPNASPPTPTAPPRTSFIANVHHFLSSNAPAPIPEDNDPRRIPHLQAGLKEIKKTRKAREVYHNQLQVDCKQLFKELENKRRMQAEEDAIEATIRKLQTETETKREKIAALESELVEYQRADMNLWAWKRRFLTVAVMQEKALEKAERRVTEAEADQTRLYQKAIEADREHLGLYDQLNNFIIEVNRLGRQLVEVTEELGKVAEEKGIESEEKVEEATKKVVKAAKGRLARWAKRQDLLNQVNYTQRVFNDVHSFCDYNIQLYQDQIEAAEDEFLESRKNFADAQAKFNSGSLRYSLTKWEEFDWNEVPLQPYQIYELELRGNVMEVDLGNFFVDDIVVLKSTLREYRVDMGLPIDSGDFRQVHRVLDVTGNNRAMGKVFHVIRGIETDRACALNMAKISIMCDLAARQFCEVLRRAGLGSWNIYCIPVRLLMLPYAPASSRVNEERLPTCMMIEEYLPGSFSKFVDNFGRASSEYEDNEIKDIFSTMAHWTFAASHSRFLLADLQGVADRATRTIILTDPGVHTLHRRFTQQLDNDMDANYRAVGIHDFFTNHECNELCRRLGLENFKFELPPQMVPP
ncbi:hypothetical protein HDU96_007063 [Phlyctochytrium bullatum]|nr:hypothetical protein HDU96_007063 [Phlyctochytrium bullatum]